MTIDEENFMHEPSTPRNAVRVASAILAISIFQPQASFGQVPVSSPKIDATLHASTIHAGAEEHRTEYTSIGTSLDGVPRAVITRIDGVFAHPAFADAAPSHQDSTRPSFFHRFLPKFHGASSHENLPAFQLFFNDGSSVIVSPGSPMMPEGSERIHLARPDGRLHYSEAPPLQEWTWAGRFKIEKPPDGIPLDQYARGLVASWRNVLKAQRAHPTPPTVSSLKHIIAEYRHSLNENTGREISR